MNAASIWPFIDLGQSVEMQGTAGQQQTKELADPSAAQRHADKQIAEKLRKGYLETMPA